MSIPEIIISGTDEEAELAARVEKEHPGLTP